MTEQTRTEKTEEAYQRRFQYFIDATRKIVGAEPSLEEVVDHVISLNTQVYKSTWRQYRSAMRYVLTSLDEMDLLKKINDCSTSDCLDKSVGTSANKKKFITEKEEKKIVQALKDKHKKKPLSWASTHLAYFVTGIATGMRPIEFYTANVYSKDEFIASPHNGSFDGQFPVLVVQNAKATNGRSFDKHRYVDISGLDEATILTVKAAIKIAKSLDTPSGKAKDYEQFYKRLFSAFSSFIKDTMTGRSRNISMYSTRHQCIADLKHMGCTLEEIAAIVGHGTDVTASKHYGKKRVGRKRAGRARGAKSDIAKVKRIRNTAVNAPKPSFT